MGGWLLRLSAKILALLRLSVNFLSLLRLSVNFLSLLRLSVNFLSLLRLSVNFFQLRLTKKLKIYFFCCKRLNINKPVVFLIFKAK